MPSWKPDEDLQCQTTPQAEALILNQVPCSTAKSKSSPRGQRVLGARATAPQTAVDVQGALTMLQSIRLELFASLRNG